MLALSTQMGTDVGEVHPGVDWTSKPGERYSVVIRLRLFETDVPPYHMWDPTGDKFRVIWTRDIRKDVP